MATLRGISQRLRSLNACPVPDAHGLISRARTVRLIVGGVEHARQDAEATAARRAAAPAHPYRPHHWSRSVNRAPGVDVDTQ
jgi:hypothetical protein